MASFQNKLMQFTAVTALGLLTQAAQAATAGLMPINDTCALKFISQNLCATITFDAPPAAGAESTLHLTFRPLQKTQVPNQTQTTPVDPVGEVSLFLWMPEMGHGSSPASILHASTPGTYLVRQLYFVMSGLWEIHVELKNEHSVDQAVLNQNIN